MKSYTNRSGLLQIAGFLQVCILSLAVLACENELSEPDGEGRFTSVSEFSAEQSDEINGIVDEYLENYRYISLGVIKEGELVLIRSFGEDRIGKTDEYASVSKPVTSMITFRMLEEGLIGSLYDAIGSYDPKYKDVLPDKFPDVEVNFSHLLSHTSGIPHHDRIWENGKLDLEFAPGTDIMYSTRGYGVLGEVLSNITGKSYNKLVKEYIGSPVQASSMTAPLPFFEAPGGLVQSTITDLMLFINGVMNSTYVEDSLLLEYAWDPVAVDPESRTGMGWYILNPHREDLAIYHAGSNGRPRAFILAMPHRRSAIGLLGKNKDPEAEQEFEELAIRLGASISEFTLN